MSASPGGRGRASAYRSSFAVHFTNLATLVGGFRAGDGFGASGLPL
jgi:hypothetical protein